MTRTLIHPWHKKVQDTATVRLGPLANSPTRSSIEGSRTGTASSSDNNSPQRSSSFGSHNFHRSATMASFLHDNAISVVKGLPRKRKLQHQKSFPDSSLYTAPRRARRNDLVPVVQAERVKYNRWFIQPRATWKVRWDLWIGFIIAYSVVLIPYRIGFGIELAVRKLGLQKPISRKFLLGIEYDDVRGLWRHLRGHRWRAVYSIFVACLGSICVGMIIANIQMLTENYNPRGIMLKQKLQDTKEFLSSAASHVVFDNALSRNLNFTGAIAPYLTRITCFSNFLEVFSTNSRCLHGGVREKFPFFGRTSVEFFVFAIPRLRPIVLGPGQVLVDAESVWEELYFLTAGTVETVQSNLVVGSSHPARFVALSIL
ncbi:Cyclic nucleotide-binding-like [Phytophthora cactorum]|nr:Cyclic nucleotide-binding-like [Phytophthora cactorum]